MIENPLKGKSEYGWHFEQNVYFPKSIVPSIKAGGDTGNIPKIIVRENLWHRKNMLALNKQQRPDMQFAK